MARGKSARLIWSSVALLFGAALAMPSGAGCPGGRCGGISGPPVPPLKGSPSRLAVVTAAEGNKITVGKKVYLVDGDAEIVVNGQPADAAAIQPGMRVLLSSKVIDRKNGLYKATRVTARTPGTSGNE